MNMLPLDAQLLLLLMVKIMFIIGAFLYLIFGFVVVRQIQLMCRTVKTPHSQYIRLLGLLHLIFAFGVLFLFIIIL